MGKHNKHPDRSPGRDNNDLAANEPSKAKLAYKIIIFATVTVKLINVGFAIDDGRVLYQI